MSFSRRTVHALWLTAVLGSAGLAVAGGFTPPSSSGSNTTPSTGSGGLVGASGPIALTGPVTVTGTLSCTRGVSAVTGNFSGAVAITGAMSVTGSITLKSALSISNTQGGASWSAIVATATAGNGAGGVFTGGSSHGLGVSAQGTGIASGVSATGGAAGGFGSNAAPGVTAVGGSNTTHLGGSGVSATGGASTAGGGGTGVKGIGGATGGTGVWGVGGATGGAGGFFQGTGGGYSVVLDGVLKFLSGGILGTTTNDSATAGNVGEFVSATVAVGSAISLSNGTGANVTSISLTAGDWDISGAIGFGGSPTGGTYTEASFSTTSATSATAYGDDVVVTPTMPQTSSHHLTLPTLRKSLSGTTTIYLVAKAGFTGGTCSAWGRISARRVR